MVAKFSGLDGAWGGVLRGTHGLTSDKLEDYLKMRVGEYSKSFKWLPKDSQLRWLKKDIVTIDGRKCVWAPDSKSFALNHNLHFRLVDFLCSQKFARCIHISFLSWIGILWFSR